MDKRRNFYEQVLRKRIITTVREVRVKIVYNFPWVLIISRRQIKSQSIRKIFIRKTKYRIYKNY